MSRWATPTWRFPTRPSSRMSPCVRNIAGAALRRPWPTRLSERLLREDSIDSDCPSASTTTRPSPCIGTSAMRDVGIPPRRVQGTIQIRTGPIDVDDTLLTLEKSLERTPGDP